MIYIILIITQFIIYYLIHIKSELFNLYEYDGIQKSHDGFVPRMGGIVIILYSYLLTIFNNVDSYLLEWPVIIGSLLIALIGTKEDLFGNVKPISRFLIILICSLIVILSLEKFPIITIPVFEEFLQFRIIEIVFFVFALSALTNGINIIDGANGLAGLSLITMFMGLIILGNTYENYEIIKMSLMIIFPIIIFLIFNFPFGKIFLGDTGAYWLGWILGIFIIKFFASNPQISTWSAVIIVSYPILEVLFSFIRKFLDNRSPFDADHKHIHVKLFFAINSTKENKNFISSLVSICLMPLWFVPISLLAWIDKIHYLVFLSLMMQIILYFLYFFILPTPDRKVLATLIPKFKK